MTYLYNTYISVHILSCVTYLYIKKAATSTITSRVPSTMITMPYSGNGSKIQIHNALINALSTGVKFYLNKTPVGHITHLNYCILLCKTLHLNRGAPSLNPWYEQTSYSIWKYLDMKYDLLIVPLWFSSRIFFNFSYIILCKTLNTLYPRALNKPESTLYSKTDKEFDKWHPCDRQSDKRRS